MKLHSIGRIDTELSKKEIIERVKKITIPEKGLKLSFRQILSYYTQYKLRDGKFCDDEFSLTYMPCNSGGDVLVPRITGKIVEKENGCVVELFFSITWPIILFFGWLIFVVLMTVIGHSGILNILCYSILYFFIAWGSKRHCAKRISDTIDVLEREVFGIVKEPPMISDEIKEAERQIEEQYKGMV